MATRFLLSQVDRYLDECDRTVTAASVQGLADYLCLSRQELARHCLAKTGLPAGDLLRRRQLARACDLLVDTDLTIEVIAMHCGFGGERSFYRAFRAARKMTPTTFRRQHGK